MITARRLKPLLIAVGLLIALQVHAQSIFWVDTNFHAPQLGKANTDGSSPVEVPLTVGTLPEGLALDAENGNLYWAEADFTGAGVKRARVDLGGATTLVTGESSLRGVSLDFLNGKIYWSSSNLIDGGAIHRANLDGTSPEIFLALGNTSNPRGVAVYAVASRVYWADYDQNTIFSAPITGGAITLLASTGSGPWGVAIDPIGAALYWTEYVTGAIRRAPLAGGPATTVLTGLGNPTYLAIDGSAGKMYWSEAAAGAQKIQRANLDGTLVQNLGLPITTYGGLAVGSSEPTETLLLLLQADAVTAGIEVRWQFANPAQFPSAVVQRAESSNGPWREIPVELRVESGSTVALDRDVRPGQTYQYRLAATTPGGQAQIFGPVTATAGEPVVEFALTAIAPNPTNGRARIDYAVAREAIVRLSIMDVQGRELTRLVDGVQTPGRYQAVWTGETQRGRAPNGLYFVRYQSPGKVTVRRLVLAR